MNPAALDAASARYTKIIAARDLINELINHTDTCDTDPYAPDDAHSLNADALRDMIVNDCDIDDLPDDIADHDERLPNAIATIFMHRDRSHAAREILTALCLDFSICPMHFDDYAACFDDENPECAAIRMIHPNHDT